MMPQNNQNQITVFAETNFRGQCRRFGMKLDDRRRHMYLIGKTGMGKSTTLENMIISDIQANRGIAVIDPHGDLVEKVINYIPKHRVNDVVYFNPSDLEWPIAFNILETVDPAHKHLVASGLIGVFYKLWADTWGPRLEYVLRNAILALLDFPGSTLLGIMRILIDKAYRKKVISKIKDPVVKTFWLDEYSRYPDRFQVEAINPIQNKVGQFLSNPLIRNIVGQVKSTIDMRDIMDNQKILLLNLAKGRIGEDTSQLLGAMMITKIQLAAMERIDLPEAQRKDFYLYVDEFQNFATESFANILSEARKYRLNLIIAHQYIEQLDEKVRAAVFGNVGTIICYRVGAIDAEELVKEFTPRFTEEDLVNLTKYNVYLKLMIDGVSSDAFSATTLPPLSQAKKTDNREKIIKISRERYAKQRKVIEEKITRWIGVEGIEEKSQKREEVSFRKEAELPAKVKAKPAQANISPYRYETKCWQCGNNTQVSFAPDGIRPVYCKDCLKQTRTKRKNMIRLKTPQTSNKTNPGVKIEPKIIGEEAKSVSLGEALKQKPISFHHIRKISSKETPTSSDPKTASKIDPALEDNSRAAVRPKKLKPGEIVKFNQD